MINPIQIPPQSNPPLAGTAPVDDNSADVSKVLFEKNWWLAFNNMGAVLNSFLALATTDITPPNDPTVTAVSVIDVTGDSAGKAQKRITVSIAPPSPIGTFSGVSVYLDHPDSSGTLAIADGTQAADGTVAAGGIFNPDYIGNFPYNPSSPTIVFQFSAPSLSEFWRVYIVPSSDAVRAPVIQFGQAGASPSFQFLVNPPASLYAGRECAPLVESPALSSLPSGWATNPLVSIAQSGDQYFEFQATWIWPTFDQNFQTIGGIRAVLDDGSSRKVIGQVFVPSSVQPGVISTEAEALYASTHLAVQPGSTPYTVWLVSFDKSGNTNSIVSGITPSITFTITRSTGSAGVEYCPVVTTDGVHALVTVAPVAGADGTSLLRITGYFTAPPDPSFGGAEIVVLKPDGSYYSVKSGRLTPIQEDVSQPASVESWTFYIRSIDINGLRNTIVGGVTPSITISVGNTSGLLNIAKAVSGSFSSEFQIVGGVFKVLNLSAATVTTGILQVGGGGSKVSQMKIFDTLSSLIGFIGDDTLGTGYVGAWFKQARIGGSGPSTAPLQADTSGNVTITNATITSVSGGFTTTLSSATLVTSGTGFTQSWTPGVISIDQGSGNVTEMIGGSFQITVGGGTPKMFVGTDGSSNGQIKINGTQVLSTRSAIVPVVFSDVVSILQHHGLCS